MSIFYEKHEEIEDLAFDMEELGNTVVNGVLDYFDCPYECEVSIYLTTDEEIHEINQEQREIDRATDVLSFPMVEWEEVNSFDWLETQLSYFHPESGELMLGDIIISLDTLMTQAQEYGHTPTREYSFLIVHSMLHLLGYDHMVENERIVMEEIQDKIMNKLAIYR